jgi:wobble nucleotide-excising tRNase
MIKRLDIPNFGSFHNFVWCDSMRDQGNNIHDFRRLNILYGRNYSGKTTLSKIMRAFERHELPEHYGNPQFSLITDDGTLNETDLYDQTTEFRVYNTDFVDDYLSFLTGKENGIIRSFAVVGSENIAIEEEVTAKLSNLGSTDTGTGLHSLHEQAKAHARKAQEEFQSSNTKLEDTFRRFASDEIRKKPGRYNKHDYNKNDLRTDISTINNKSITVVADKIRNEREQLLEEVERLPIGKSISFEPQFDSLRDQAFKLLGKNIESEHPIDELLNDPALQAWVKNGIQHHRGKRDTCGFCRQPLPKTIFDEFDAHFNKASKAFEDEIAALLAELATEIENAENMIDLKPANFYTAEQGKFEWYKRKLDDAVVAYRSVLNQLVTILNKRQENLFVPVEPPQVTYTSGRIKSLAALFNRLISKNDRKTENLSIEKETARTQQRLDSVATFMRDQSIGALQAKLKELRLTATAATAHKKQLAKGIDTLEREIEALRSKQSDENQAAETINGYLTHHFGHNSLRLQAVEDTLSEGVRFQIMRGNEPAYNLSEGERGLISFCYFIAKLEDTEAQGKHLTICIDDPVSSLDTNHIFFVYSLIENMITRPEKRLDGSNDYRYDQLFILTHNLDFLKYLKRLSKPKKNTSHLVVEFDGSSSKLVPMPRHLEKYATEFIYLFQQIYTCAKPTNIDESPGPFYSFGNNLRKFLETFLYFKYPHQEDQNDTTEKVRKYFGDDRLSTVLAERITNELSHLAGIPDRSTRPVDIPEISDLANFVLSAIERNDSDQYESLLLCIDED